MRRAILFGIILGAGIALLAIVAWYSTTAYLATGSSSGSWNEMMGGMWGGMMGNNYNGGYSANPVLQYSWIGTFAALGLCILGTGGLVYYLAYPQISYTHVATVSSPSSTALSTQTPEVARASLTPGSNQEERHETVSPLTSALRDGKIQDNSHKVEKGRFSQKADSWPVLLRTSKPDERKVLEVLAAHNGKYLQKYISKETGLSKLRTHRIIARFVERGIVTASRSGNTNEVSLADWLKKPDSKATQP